MSCLLLGIEAVNAQSYLNCICMYSCHQKSAYSNGTASAETLEWMLCVMQMAVRSASVSRQACAPAAMPVAVENACAASYKGLGKAG